MPEYSVLLGWNADARLHVVEQAGGEDSLGWLLQDAQDGSDAHLLMGFQILEEVHLN